MSSGVGGCGRGVGLRCGFDAFFSWEGEGDGLGEGETEPDGDGESEGVILSSGVGDVSAGPGGVADDAGVEGSLVCTFAPRSL